jgi:Lon protease-like protein
MLAAAPVLVATAEADEAADDALREALREADDWTEAADDWAEAADEEAAEAVEEALERADESAPEMEAVAVADADFLDMAEDPYLSVWSAKQSSHKQVGMTYWLAAWQYCTLY